MSNRAQLELFRERLPRKPYHTDELTSGLSIADVSRALGARYIQPNGPTHRHWIVFDVDQPVATPAVWKGQANSVKIGRTEAIVVSVPSGSGSKLSTEVIRQDPLIAPITKGQSMGTLRVKMGNDTVAEVPLIALEDVAEAGFFGRMWDTIRLWIK